MKVFFCIFGLLIVALILARTILMIVVFLVCAIMSGFFEYTCKIYQKIGNYSCWLVLLCLPLLPLIMVLGIGYAIYDRFWFHIDEFIYFGVMDVFNYYKSALIF